MKYFTMEECIHSKVARERGIDNTPSPEIEAHITESVESLLDPLREAWEACSRKQGWGTPAIRISSGYRCRELNRAVGGSATSAHRYGYAFDLIPLNGRMREFKAFCREFLKGRAFDQLISENENDQGLPQWMHVGCRHPDGKLQRGQLLSLVNGRYLPMICFSRDFSLSL